MSNQVVYPKVRERKDRSYRRWMVEYDLAYDGGGSEWVGYYTARWLAWVAIKWNMNFASWGGHAILTDQRGRAAKSKEEK